MQAEETIGEIVGNMGKFHHGKEEETREARGCGWAETNAASGKLLTLRIKKSLEGMFIEGRLEKPDSFFKAQGSRIYEAHLYSIQQNLVHYRL